MIESDKEREEWGGEREKERESETDRETNRREEFVRNGGSNCDHN